RSLAMTKSLTARCMVSSGGSGGSACDSPFGDLLHRRTLASRTPRLRTGKANRLCRGDEATRSPTPSQATERAVVGLPAAERIASDAAPALGEGRQTTGDAVGVVEPAA